MPGSTPWCASDCRSARVRMRRWIFAFFFRLNFALWPLRADIISSFGELSPGGHSPRSGGTAVYEFTLRLPLRLSAARCFFLFGAVRWARIRGPIVRRNLADVSESQRRIIGFLHGKVTQIFAIRQRFRQPGFPVVSRMRFLFHGDSRCKPSATVTSH